MSNKLFTPVEIPRRTWKRALAYKIHDKELFSRKGTKLVLGPRNSRLVRNGVLFARLLRVPVEVFSLRVARRNALFQLASWAPENSAEPLLHLEAWKVVIAGLRVIKMTVDKDRKRLLIKGDSFELAALLSDILEGIDELYKKHGSNVDDHVSVNIMSGAHSDTREQKRSHESPKQRQGITALPHMDPKMLKWSKSSQSLPSGKERVTRKAVLPSAIYSTKQKHSRFPYASPDKYSASRKPIHIPRDLIKKLQRDTEIALFQVSSSYELLILSFSRKLSVEVTAAIDIFSSSEHKLQTILIYGETDENHSQLNGSFRRIVMWL